MSTFIWLVIFFICRLLSFYCQTKGDILTLVLLDTTTDISRIFHHILFSERLMTLVRSFYDKKWSHLNRLHRSRHQRCYIMKGVLINFAKFTAKHLCQSLFLNKVAGLWCRCFPVNFTKFLRTPFFTEQLRRLFLITDWYY